MRKPPNLSNWGKTFDVLFDDGTSINNVELQPSQNKFEAEFEHMQYASEPVQSDWAQEDPKESSYIKNKQIAEQYRPVYVEDQVFLGTERATGRINFEGVDGISLKVDKDTLKISAKDIEEKIKDIQSNDIVAGEGLKMSDEYIEGEDRKRRVIGIDDEVTFIIDCN